MSAYGSLEVFYSYEPNDAGYIELRTDVLGLAGLTPEINVPGVVYVRVGSETISSVKYVSVSTVIGGNVADTSNFPLGATINDFDIRIVFFDDTVSVYCNGLWVYSFGFASIEYNYPPAASLYASGAAITLTNVRLTELPDGREAVYVDYEQTSQNAIQSIIQQRPVEIYGTSDRELAFTYNGVRDDVPAHHIKRISENIADNSALSSDGLVYYAEVGMQVNEDVARDVGLLTSMYRLSELNTGALDAARILQQKAYERRHRIGLDMRLDQRIEIGDRLHISETVTGTGRSIDKYMVVEDVRISIREGDSGMSVNGRKVTVGS